jgi:hypothetical protein
MTFNLNQYLSEMTVDQDDKELEKANDIVEMTEIVCDDPWLARQDHYGSAGAMERQLTYLGTTLLPSAERKIKQMSSTGVMGESYVTDNWFGTTNEDSQHESEEVPLDQQIDDQQAFAEGLRNRMRTAAILFVTRVRAHDRLSKELEQLTYAGIKGVAAQNRQKREAASATG